MSWTVMLYIVGAILFAWFWRWANHPSPLALESPQAVLSAFRALLQRGAKGARTRFQARHNAALRVDFVKYIKSQNDVGFTATLSRTAPLSAVFDVAARELEERGIRFVKRTNREGLDELAIDFVHDFGLAQLFSRIIFEKAMGLTMERDVVATFDLVLNSHNARLTGLDSPSAF